jgi:hypothetical protein
MGSIPYLYLVDEAKTLQAQNDEIIKEVCFTEDFGNIEGDDIRKICDGLGAKAGDCTDQLDGSENTGYSLDFNIKYWKAVKKGYKGTMKEFDERQKKLAKGLGVATTGAGFVAGLFSKESNQGDSVNYGTKTTEDTKPKMSIGSILGLSVGVMALIGVGLYFALRNPKN